MKFKPGQLVTLVSHREDNYVPADGISYRYDHGGGSTAIWRHGEAGMILEQIEEFDAYRVLIEDKITQFHKNYLRPLTGDEIVN